MESVKTGLSATQCNRKHGVGISGFFSSPVRILLVFHVFQTVAHLTNILLHYSYIIWFIVFFYQIDLYAATTTTKILCLFTLVVSM